MYTYTKSYNSKYPVTLISNFPRVELKFKITLDWEFFALKLICNMHGVKFFTFRSIWEIFLTVDSYNRDKHLEHS